MEFECMSCGRMFAGTWFEVARSFQRVHFNSPSALDEIETEQSEGLSECCCTGCHEAVRGAVMQQQQVPIPSVRPDIGPVETCAKCSGPVDMSHWHLTFDENKMEDQGWAAATLEQSCMAVVCKQCAPYGRLQASELSDAAADASLPAEAAPAGTLAR